MQIDADFRDEVIAHLQTRYPCTKSEEMVDNMLLLCRRRLFGEELKLIKQPTLILREPFDQSLHIVNSEQIFAILIMQQKRTCVQDSLSNGPG